MQFNEYQQKSQQTAIYPNRGNNITYPALGLAGEAGEVANKVKKIFRDNNGQIDRKIQLTLIKELGDVLWYIAAMCYELGLDLDEVAIENIARLRSRKQRNQLQGDGDNR